MCLQCYPQLYFLRNVNSYTVLAPLRNSLTCFPISWQLFVEVEWSTFNNCTVKCTTHVYCIYVCCCSNLKVAIPQRSVRSQLDLCVIFVRGALPQTRHHSLAICWLPLFLLGNQMSTLRLVNRRSRV